MSPTGSGEPLLPQDALPRHDALRVGNVLGSPEAHSDGIKNCLESFFTREPFARGYIIVERGRVTSLSYRYAYEG